MENLLRTILRPVLNLMFPPHYKKCDHLEPFSELSEHQGYYQNPELVKGLSDMPIVRYKGGHSLSFMEYILSLEYDKSHYRLVYRRLPKNPNEKHPYNKDFKLPDSTIKERIISTLLAKKIHALFQLALQQCRPYDKLSFGPDGEVHCFFTEIEGSMYSGFKWSPNEASKIGELVSICMKLIRFVVEKSNNEAVIETKIEGLIKRLNK